MMNVYESIFQKYGLSPTQQEIIRIVGTNKTILEIGSSSGYMTKLFLENSCTVDVVESDKGAVLKLPKKVRQIFHTSIEDEKIYSQLKTYDFIIMADVLEHLIKPELVLQKLTHIASSHTRLMLSLPNIACWPMRKQLFFSGDFEYQGSGLLDKTHLHFYTVNTLPKLLKENGWKIEKLTGTIIRLPLEGLIGKIPIINFIFKKLFYKKIADKFKNLTYYHFLVEAVKL